MKQKHSSADIAAALSTLAPRLRADLGDTFTMVPILTGGFMMAADLARALHAVGCDPEIDFLQLSSYGTGRESSGDVRFLKDITLPIADQTVLLVDDVLDSGRSLHFAKSMLLEKGAAQVRVCVAVEKKKDRPHPITADYALFEMPEDAFLVGYGMDDAGLRRGLPYIGELD